MGSSSWSVDGVRADLDAAHGDLVDLGGVPAIVTAVLRDHVELALLSARRPTGGPRRLGPLTVPIGQVGARGAIDALGLPREGNGPTERVPLFGRDPVLPREGRTPRLTLGTLSFDLQHVFGAGSSLLATGPREVLHHVLRHQVLEGRAVIVATPQPTSPDHLALRCGDVPCLHVAAPADATAAHSWLVPWAAMAIADAWRRTGAHVVVSLDLDAWRPHVRRFPQRGGWPTQVATLSSRAYAAEGSVTLIASTDQVDASRAAAFDATIDLALAQRGELSPRTSTLVRPPIRLGQPQRLGAAIAATSQLARLEQLATHALDRMTEQRLADGRRIRECLRRCARSTHDSVEQLLCLLATITHPELPVERVGAFVAAYQIALRGHADRLAAIRRSRVLEPADERALLAIAAQVLA